MTRQGTGKHGSTADPVRAYLKSRGVSDDIVEGGLESVVERWDSISKTAKDYDFTLDDWLNDMDLRDIIHGAMTAATAADRESVSSALKKADERLKKATAKTGSIWGTAMQGDLAPHPVKNWWYFRRPLNPGETMADDLEAAGLD
ncbi:MAG: hypothetical protein ABIZ36_14255 [Gemmatimonadaceae bacterium]